MCIRDSLIARLSEDPEVITEQSMKYANEMFQEWREINQFLIQVDTDFIVWACLDFYEPVSYTHLDVYKRQISCFAQLSPLDLQIA